MANTQFIADLVSRVDQLLNQHNALQHTLQQTSAQLAQAEAERDTLRTQLHTQQEQHHTEQAALATQLSNVEAERDLVRALNGELAREVTGIVEDVKGVVTDPIRALSVYDQVSRRWEGMRAELAITGGLPTGILSDAAAGSASSVPTIDTPTEQDAAMANGAAFTALITRASAAAAASAIASANLGSDRDFTAAQDGTVTIGQSLTGDQVNNPLSRPVVMDGVVGVDRNLLLTADDLEAMANKLAAILAELAMDAVEAGESDVWRSLRDLRLAVLNDSRERGTQLPRRRQLVLTTTTPSALLAWQQYGDAEYRDRLVSNNKLRDPAFITPSTRVEVLDEVTNG